MHEEPLANTVANVQRSMERRGAKKTYTYLKKQNNMNNPLAHKYKKKQRRNY